MITRTAQVLCIIACIVAGAAAARAELRPEQAEKNRPVAAFRIIGNVYYVGASDVTSYLIRTSDGLILLDGGFAETAPQIKANIATLGFKVEDIKLLLNGHAHPDHTGGLPALKQASSAQLLAVQEEVVPLEHNGRGTFYRGDRRLFDDMKVDRIVASGEPIRFGDVTITPYRTPGHSPGCTTWTTQVREGGRQYNVVFVCQLTGAAWRVTERQRELPADRRRLCAHVRTLASTAVRCVPRRARHCVRPRRQDPAQGAATGDESVHRPGRLPASRRAIATGVQGSAGARAVLAR